MRKLPSQEFLREILNFDARSGEFTWRRVSPSKIRLMGCVAGTVRKFGYIYISVPGFGQMAAHRLAWIYTHGGLIDEIEIDHIDGNPSNNAIINLRLATSSQQKQNKRVQSNNRSGLKGAFYHACRAGKKWRSQIKIEENGKKRLIFLGYYPTALEAHLAYAVAARQHFGEFARVA